jgi:hypothetical protein
MNSSDKRRASFKKKIVHEMVEYWINVAYLTLMFAAFTQYRRFVLAAHDITYTNYWVAVIEALVLAKVVMIGDVLRLGRRLEDRPLIYTTLLKTVVFTIFVGAFTLVERVIKGLWHGQGIAEQFNKFLGKGSHELLAGCLVVFVAFIPFFAFRELRRILGEGKLWALFFRRRGGQGSERSGPEGA